MPSRRDRSNSDLLTVDAKTTKDVIDALRALNYESGQVVAVTDFQMKIWTALKDRALFLIEDYLSINEQRLQNPTGADDFFISAAMLQCLKVQTEEDLSVGGIAQRRLLEIFLIVMRANDKLPIAWSQDYAELIWQGRDVKGFSLEPVVLTNHRGRVAAYLALKEAFAVFASYVPNKELASKALAVLNMARQYLHHTNEVMLYLHERVM